MSSSDAVFGRHNPLGTRRDLVAVEVAEMDQSLSSCARLILGHLLTSGIQQMSAVDLVRFSPVDRDIVDRKEAAHENAKAAEELIRAGFVGLWVIDGWLPASAEEQSAEQTAAGVRPEDVEIELPDLALVPTEEGRAYWEESQKRG